MKTATLLTLHQKADCISSALAEADFQVVEFRGFNTDELGTFCGTIARTKDAKATAEHKAKLACELSGTRFGMGSEGSFFEHPIAGITWEQEVLCLFDSIEGTSMFGLSEGPAAVVSVELESQAELAETVAATAPQKWMWQDINGNWHKGLDGDTVGDLIADSGVKFPQLIVPDYRAMHCPSRQKLIARAASDLVKRLLSTCPVCHTPNFVYDHKQDGLPCATCSLPTTQAKGWWAECDNCGFKDFSQSPDAFAESVDCPFCNP